MSNKANLGRQATGAGRTNKANSTGLPGPRSVKRAKRTQFGEARLRSGDRLCETKPNVGGLGYLGDDARGEPVVRNKANCLSGRCRAEPVLSPPKERPTHEEPKGHCAKQTQFAPGDGKGQVL